MHIECIFTAFKQREKKGKIGAKIATFFTWLMLSSNKRVFVLFIHKKAI